MDVAYIIVLVQFFSDIIHMFVRQVRLSDKIDEKDELPEIHERITFETVESNIAFNLNNLCIVMCRSVYNDIPKHLYYLQYC